MKTSIVKPIIGGIFLGAFVFFTGPLLFIVLLLKFIFTPFGMGRMNRGFSGGSMGFNPQMRLAMAEKVRRMSDEDFTAFKEKMNHRFGNCNKFNN